MAESGLLCAFASCDFNNSKGSKYHLLGGPFGYVITYNPGRFYNIFKKAKILYQPLLYIKFIYYIKYLKSINYKVL